MKRIEQTRTGADGNCLNACIASILELPLKDVPEFGDDWLMDLNDFLQARGLSYRRVPIDGAKPSGWGTIEGVSPRGGLHACVAFDGELVWDPHPISMRDGQGLVEPRYYGLIEPVLGVTGKEARMQRSLGLDRADMMTLRRNTRRQGGPFNIQETEKDGSTRVVPVKNLAKGADASLTSWAALLLAVYAAYRLREEKPETYDLTKYIPNKRIL